MIVLQYIYSCSQRFETFVANRLSVIHDGPMPRQWRKVGTKDNPADDVPRGFNGFEMIFNRRWKQGPEFLWQDETAWPTNPAVTEIACRDEKAKNQVKSCIFNVQCDAGDKARHGMPRVDKEQESEDPMVQFIESYSCWHHLKTSVAWLLCCTDWLRARTKRKERPPSVISDPLDLLELQAAETAIIKSVQHQYFKGEVGALKSTKPVVKSLTYILEPFLDKEGILRVGGRLKNAPLPEKAQHTIVLPKKHHISRLVVRRAHEFQSGHSRKEYILSLIRQKFWIVGARPLVKRVLRECVLCKRLKGKSGVQQLADLQPWSKHLGTVMKIKSENALLK